MNINFKKYKSYESDSNNFKMEKINVLIGRNNAGKSSVGDIIEFCSDPTKYKNRVKQIQGISYQLKLTKDIIKNSFSESTSGGEIRINHYKYGNEFIGKNINIDLNFIKQGGKIASIATLSENNVAIESNGKIFKKWSEVADKIGNPLSKLHVLRVHAERDLRPENDSEDLVIEANGTGITNLIHKFINSSKLDSKLVENNVLEALNEIMSPDSNFADIIVQQVEINEKILWEIFLEEVNGNRIALSESGSGLKTVIIVLANLYLMPVVLKKNLSQIIFIFEELENNLHPALQRNLFNYIKDKIINENSMVFFTTHSHVAINLFDKIDNSQILHIIKKENISEIIRVDSILEKYSILNDLEVNASDILQSNGVIWVEGPSDRIYLNKWINMFSNGLIKENIHYQIMFYGGRLLSHLSFDVEKIEDVNEFIKLVKLNRNSAILIDSDKKSKRGHINKTKRRIKEDFKQSKSFCWITSGKEIENYLQEDLILKTLEVKSNEVFDDYERIDEFLNRVKNKEGIRFLRSKVNYAHAFISNMGKADIEKGDLKEKIYKLVTEIKLWNGMKE